MDFKTEFIAEKVLKAKQGTDVGGRAIIIDFLGEKSAQMSKQVPGMYTTLYLEKQAMLKVGYLGSELLVLQTSYVFYTAEATPTNTLMVKNLSYKVKEDSLKKVFKKAVSVKIPKMHGKRRG